MPGERFDYTNERQRHEKFVGREALLARLDALSVGDGDDRWVMVTGGPGMGKSAILSAWLGRREAAGAVVPHHFIRRGAYDWDDPAQLVGSLVAQLDERFPGAREPDPGVRMHPAARLAKALSRVSEQELSPRSERLVVLIDGLDEYDPPAGALPGDPIVAGDIAGGIWFLDWPPSDRRATQLGIADRENRQHESRPAPEASSSRLTMKKHTILFLAANPMGTSQLALGEEARAIQAELERSSYRDCFALETRWAAQPLDLLRELRKLKPTVVHFSGHGGPSPVVAGPTSQTPSRDVIANVGTYDNELQRGLFFQGPDGRAQVVTAQALHDTFGAAGSSVKLVILNACYSDVQAEALRAHVDCVVGMSGSIGDDAARNFAIGFYGGLGERESIAAAFRQGCAAISLEGLRDSDRPQLTVRDGVDASKLVLGFPVSHDAMDPR